MESSVGIKGGKQTLRQRVKKRAFHCNFLFNGERFAHLIP